MDTLPVLTLDMSGAVTSFRYPFFTQGYQPTFEMPPPSTIYGHLCSAYGDYLPPQGWQFGYRFTHSGRFVDYKEHLHYDDPVEVNPYDRELLFKPNLLLYIHHPDIAQLEILGNRLVHPHYAVNLGRSQDLMTYHSIQLRELHRAEVGYFEHTLLPLRASAVLERRMIPVTMPRYVDSRRRVINNAYAMLTDIALFPPTPPEPDEDEDVHHQAMLTFEEDVTWLREHIWIDPQSPHHNKYPTHQRAIYLHRFVDED